MIKKKLYKIRYCGKEGDGVSLTKDFRSLITAILWSRKSHIIKAANDLLLSKCVEIKIKRIKEVLNE